MNVKNAQLLRSGVITICSRWLTVLRYFIFLSVYYSVLYPVFFILTANLHIFFYLFYICNNKIRSIVP